MQLTNQTQTRRKLLLDRYYKLIEKERNYRFIDESKSDFAAFKAMKVLTKINKICYLSKENLLENKFT